MQGVLTQFFSRLSARPLSRTCTSVSSFDEVCKVLSWFVL